MSVLKQYDAAAGMWQTVGGMGLPQTPVSFSAHKGGTDQSSCGPSNTKITFPTIDYQYGSSGYDVTTSKFQPEIAGVYTVTVCLGFTPTGGGCVYWLNLYKNGISYKTIGQLHSSLSSELKLVGSVQVYMNGTTDYIDVYFGCSDSARTISGTSSKTYFQACLIPDSYDSTKRIIDLTSATSDYLLGVGETAKILYSGATSVPLHIATEEGEYELKLSAAPVLTSCTDGAGYLNPNNTTYSNAIKRQYLSGFSPSTVTTSQATESAFIANAHRAISTRLHISTTTTGKHVLGQLGYLSNTGVHTIQTNASIWTDTTTVWSSLGTITFANAQSGTITVRRII